MSAFFIGVLATALFFVGATSPMEDTVIKIEPNRAKALAGAILFADVTSSDKLLLVRDMGLLAFSTTTSETENATSTSVTTTATTTDSVVEDEEVEIMVQDVEEIIPIAEAVVDSVVIEEAIAEAQAQLEELQNKEVAEEIVIEEGERPLPEGVYILANGDYVDSTGAKISGDPYDYNYKPPQKEEYMTTPGGVVMDRFGNIISSPEVVDESLVLIPATIIDIDNPPSTISPIYIPRYVMLAMNQNPFLTCTQLQLYNNDRALCELRKLFEDDYEWIRVDVEE